MGKRSRGAVRLVASATVALTVAWGVAYSFGAFLQPIVDDLGSTSARVSGVFSLAAVIYFTLGWPAGMLRDRFGTRPLVLGAAAALGGGLWLASHATDTLGLYLTYGPAVGLGVGLVYVPLVSDVATRVEHKRTLALGITVSGIGIGTLIAPPVAASVIGSSNWRRALVVFGLVAASTLAATALGVPRQPSARRDRKPSGVQPMRRAVLTPRFGLLYAAASFIALALYVPFVHLPSFAETIDVDPITAASSVGVIGVSSVAGRFGLAAVGERVGLKGIYVLSYVLVAASFLLWLGSTSWPWVVAFGIVFGVGYGGFIALTPAVTTELLTAENVGGVLGILYTSAALGTALGPPLAASLIQHFDGYTGAIWLCLASGGAALVCLLASLRATISVPGRERAAPAGHGS